MSSTESQATARDDFPEVPADRTRLIDVLNDGVQTFYSLFTVDQLRLVNRHHIAYVRPVS